MLEDAPRRCAMPNRVQSGPSPLERGSPAPSSDSGMRVRPMWVFGLALAIFLADSCIPLRTGAGVAYIAVVLASLWTPRTRYTWIATVVCTACAIVRLLEDH